MASPAPVAAEERDSSSGDIYDSALAFVERFPLPLTLAAFSVLPIVFLAPLFAAPFDPDQGGYATIARGWLDGSVPYRDLWDNKGPLLYLWYLVSFQWLGEGTVAPRVVAALVVSATVPCVWGVARTLFGPREALAAAALFSLSFFNIYIQVTANAEAFMLLPLTAGFWAFALGARGGNLLWFAAAGALTALAVLTRQSAIWTFVAYGAWAGVLFLRNPGERRTHVLSMVALVGGAVLGAVPFIVYFATQDALYDFWYGMFEFNLYWSQEFPWFIKATPPWLINPAPLFGGLLFWTLAAAGIWLLWKRADRWAWLVLAMLICAEAAAQTLGKISPHYAIQLLPAASIAAAFGLTFVVDRLREGHRMWRGWMAFAALTTIGMAAFLYAQPNATERFRVQYLHLDYADDAAKAPEIAQAVALIAGPDDLVYEWGVESEIYFYSDRQPASRWLHRRPYIVDPTVARDVMEDLRRNRPEVIYLTPEAEQVDDIDYTPPELKLYLQEHYRYVGTVEYADLYERIDP
jgi:4-amino-4-deoxy-L-arabinose transferase-like glycosyltransferase